MSDRRLTFIVPVAAIRPPLWRIATCEVWELEVSRRHALQQEQPSHLPLVAELLETLQLTPESAEAQAEAHAQEADLMYKNMENVGAPPHVLDRFAEHRRLMVLQTKSAAFRQGKKLPVFILVDGALRWHVAVERGQETLFITAPAKAAQILQAWAQPTSYQADVVDTQLSLPKSSSPSAIVPTVMSTATLGAQYNYLSHVSSPMTLADRVFLLQSWYEGVLQSCNDLSVRAALEIELSWTNVLRLVLHSVVKHKGGKITLGTRLLKLALQGEKLLRKLNSLTSNLKLPGGSEYSFLIPPALSIIVAPCTSKPHHEETLLRDVSDFVMCAIETTGNSSTRILTGHILRRRCQEELSSAVDVESVHSASERNWTLSISCFESICTAVRLAKTMPGSFSATFESGAVVSGVEIALMLLSSLMNLDVDDIRGREKARVPSVWKLTRVTKTQLPPKSDLVRAVIDVCATALQQGAPLLDVCSRVSHMKVVVGAARYVLGKTVG